MVHYKPYKGITYILFSLVTLNCLCIRRIILYIIQIYCMPFTKDLLRFINKPCFIETGTYQGDTISFILNNNPIPKKFISLELSDVFFSNCVNRFKSNSNVTIYHKNSKDGLYPIIENINTEITFWLDSHWSGVPNIGCDIEKACPILEELDQIKKHQINTHTIMVDDIRLMNSSKNKFDGFDVSLDEIIQKIMYINPNYTIDYYDDFTGKKDVLVAYIKEPICIHSYLTICKTNPQPPGFADFLRGTIALYKLSQLHGYKLVIDRSHPLFIFLEGGQEIQTGPTMEFLPPLSYSTIYNELNKLFSYKKTFKVMTNSFYTKVNGEMYNWGNITESCRSFLKELLVPAPSIVSNIKSVFKNDYKLDYHQVFKAIHIRTNDSNIHKKEFDDESFNKMLNEYSKKIKSIIEKDVPYVLITDWSILANKLKETIPNLYYWDNQKIHIGDMKNNSGSALMDTVTDFFILSKADEIFYINESGFSQVVSIIYDKKYTRI